VPWNIDKNIFKKLLTKYYFYDINNNMKKLLMLFIVFKISISIVFADDYVEYETWDIIQNKIGESIEWIYIKWYSVSKRPNEPIIVNDLDQINIKIYFNAGIYKLRNDFNNIIENKLLIELKNIFQDKNIVISTLYPFSITLKDNINNELDEKQNIINKLQENTYGIIVEDIFQNSIYGHIQDMNFNSILGTENIINKILYNNINQFLENVSRYFDGENKISY
jgi:hypothetical protein